MGSIRKRNGKFQAQVRREGVPDLSKTFTSRKDATVWVRGLEARIDAGETTVAAPKAITLADVLLRYSQEVTPHKKGREAEQRRLNRLLRDPISQVLLGKLDSIEPPPLKWSAPIVRKAEDHRWLLRDPSPKRLS